MASVPDALDKSIKELGANGAYFDGLIGWFDQQIAAQPTGASLSQPNTQQEAVGGTIRCKHELESLWCALSLILIAPLRVVVQVLCC